VPSLLALAPAKMPNHAAPAVDMTAVAVSLGGTIVTVLAFAAWPAWRAAAAAHAAAMKDEGRGASAGRAKARARSVLVTAEVALSLSLLVGAGLLIQSMRQLSNVDPGVDARGVLTAA
jgi:putative ABC transport system permease protein